MKRVLAILLLAAALLLGGCRFFSLDPSGQQSGASSASGRPADYAALLEGKWCYQRLSRSLQENYAALYAAVHEGFRQDETVVVSGEERHGVQVKLPRELTSADDMTLLYTAFITDNPEFFYLGNAYSYEGYHVGDSNRYTAIILVYMMDASARLQAKQELDRVIQELVAGMPADADGFESELYLHDALLARCVYDKEAAASARPASEYPHAFSAYGALVNGRAVCEGYSRAFQLLLHEVGMDSTLVTGQSLEGEPHMWNLVTVDGYNYHVDTTWNLTEKGIRHTYFNLNTEDIQLSHTIDEGNIGIDTCTATAANYFVRKGQYITSAATKEQLAAVVAGALEFTPKTLELRFAENQYTGSMLLLTTNPRWFLSVVNEAMEPTGRVLQSYETETDDVYGIVVLTEIRQKNPDFS